MIKTLLPQSPLYSTSKGSSPISVRTKTILKEIISLFPKITLLISFCTTKHVDKAFYSLDLITL